MTNSLGPRIRRLLERAHTIDELDKASDKPILDPSEDIVAFCEKRLGFKPTSYQERLLRDEHQFIVARWARQSGKSTTLSALILYNALSRPKSRIVVLAPSLRQSRRIVERAGSFLPRLPDNILVGKVLRTRLSFINGSTIEALPNNPATVRGETTNLLICLTGEVPVPQPNRV